VELTQFTFNQFSSSVGVILFAGVGTLLLNEITSTNLAFSGSGSLVSSNLNMAGAGNLSLLNSNLSSIAATGCNGSAFSINGGVNFFNIANSTFGGPLSSSNGGAIYVLICASTVVNGSSFVGCTVGADGNGGAIYFGKNTSFTLINSSFDSCSAFYGGAIFSFSDVSTIRQILGVNFTNNSIQSGGNGNDIADNSSVGTNIYLKSSVINSTSNSTSSGSIVNFFMIQFNSDFDCLLTISGCGNDPTFVSAIGVDSDVCGTSTSPCRTVKQGVQNLINAYDPEAEINVASGDYTDTTFAVSSIKLTVSTNSATKPVLSLVAPPLGLLKKSFYILFSFFFFFQCRCLFYDHCGDQ
jgi:hypothetical protein